MDPVTIGLAAGSILKGLGGLFGAKKNKKAAKAFAEQTKWKNTGISMPGLGLSFDASGNPVGEVTDPSNQNAAASLYGLGGNLMDVYGASGNPYESIGGMFGAYMNDPSGYQNSGQIPAFLRREFMGANAGLAGLPGLDGIGPTNANQIIGQLGQLGANMQPSNITGGLGLFGQAAGNALGQLGSFDPNQLASSYTNNLRATAMPGEQRAAEGLAQRLFNTGRLGSTGGATLMGELMNQQNQADIQRQIAGQQYAGQEQSRIGALAQGLLSSGLSEQAGNVGIQAQNFQNNMGLTGALAGLLGQQAGLSQQEFGNALGLQNTAYSQGLNTTQQRFQNAMNIFGGGQAQQSQDLAAYNANTNANLGQQGNLLNFASGQGNYNNNLLSGALQSMGLGANIGNMDTANLMAMLATSGNLSQARSATDAQAYSKLYGAKVAQNNALTGMFNGVIGMIPGLNK